MKQKKRKRSGYDLTDWRRDNPDKSLDYFLKNIEDFHDPEHPEDKSDIKRSWNWADVEKEIEKQEKKSEPSPEPENVPVVPVNTSDSDVVQVIIAGRLCDVVDDSINAIDPGYTFNQGGFLVKVVNVGNESVSIKEFNAVGIADELSRRAEFKKWKGNGKNAELIPLDGPPEKIAKAIIARGEYPKIPIIRGITESPFFRKNGTVCKTHGFDSESGFYLNLSTSVPEIPDNPTREQAAEALNILREPFIEFPFVNEQSRIVPISLILSVLARPMLGNVPAFILDASTRGSGKTLISDIVSIILTGRSCPKFSWPGGRDGDVELEKTMNTAAMMGTPLMSFDNIPAKSRFGGPIIEKFVTCNGRVNFRKLGSNDNRDVFFNTVLIANGNNILDGIQDETRRRALPCRMVPDCEKPEERSGFKHNPLSKYVADNRSKFLAAGLTVLRHGLQNMPAASETWGSFEEFAQIIPPAIMAASGPNVLPNRDLVPTSGGEENEAFTDLLDVLARKFVAGFFTKDIVRKAKDDTELSEALEAVFHGGVPNSVALGRTLRGRKDRLHNGVKIVEHGKTRGAVKWNIIGASLSTEDPQQFDLISDSDY